MALITTHAPTARAPAPWYRHRWPWLLALAPAAALVGGAVTFWLAVTTADSMVVDDYYREGRAINQQLARDQRASALGLQARLSAPDGATIALAITAATPTTAATAATDTEWPAQLTLRLIHATRAELDVAWPLRHVGGGAYRANGALPARGHWLVQLEDPARSWRLVEPAVTRFDAPILLQASGP
ncbi:MAG: FixH family protein [Burkholderiaceae bacterium]|nr:FixH family protein [Burkholderiaceae bacterium]MEB2350249.1 FixH family protein [Burkholderiaceae bacterium]